MTTSGSGVSIRISTVSASVDSLRAARARDCTGVVLAAGFGSGAGLLRVISGWEPASNSDLGGALGTAHTAITKTTDATASYPHRPLPPARPPSLRYSRRDRLPHPHQRIGGYRLVLHLSEVVPEYRLLSFVLSRPVPFSDEPAL